MPRSDRATAKPTHRPSGLPSDTGSEAPAESGGERVFSTVRHLSMPDRVAEAIAAAIRDGRLKPGQQLPAQQQLAEQFGVSRLVVREALRTLEATRAIDLRAGRGAVVASSPAAVVADRWVTWVNTHRDEVLELLSIRRALEELAASRAATHATDAELRALAQNLEAFEREVATSTPNLERIVQLDVAFHDGIARAARGALLDKLVEEVALAILDSRRAGFAMPLRPDETVLDHRRVLAALQSRDADAAGAALRDHLDSVIRAVQRRLPDPPETA